MKSVLFILLYIAIPLWVLKYALSAFFRPGGAFRAVTLAGAGILGMFLGGCVASFYGWALGGDVDQSDLLLAIAMGLAAAWMFKGLDWSTEYLLVKLLGRRRGGFWRISLFFGAVIRMIALVIFCMLWIGGMLLVYRVPVKGPTIPDELITDRETVTFKTSDGIVISAWYFPAEGQMGRTAIICPGLGSRKELQLGLIPRLTRRGWNVLAIDFRGQGGSSGHCQSFGADEKLDVLAAVEWLKKNHGVESERLVGIGANTGAAALMMAAAAPGGEAIDALALIEPFDSWPETLKDVLARFLPMKGARWAPTVMNWIGSLHAGRSLWNFRPGDSAGGIWPRPVLVVHGRGVGLTPPMQEIDLVGKLGNVRECWASDGYIQMRDDLKNKKAGEQVRLILRRWIGLENSPLDDENARDVLMDFIENEQRNPVL